jgi:type III secretion protein J
MKREFRLKALAIATLALTLCACQQELYTGLPEDEANQMLATLLERGIAANKIAKGKTGYAVSVEDKDVVRALRILSFQGLPRDSYQNIGQVFSGQGMIASATEEQARLSFAISQELAETFSRIDGVLTSRVHVVLEQRDAATDTATPASAAVFLRHVPDSPVPSLTGQIRETCVQSVPGLTFDHVSVMLLPVREKFILPAAPDETRVAVSWSVWGALGALALALAGFLGVRFWQRRKAAAAAALPNPEDAASG